MSGLLPLVNLFSEFATPDDIRFNQKILLDLMFLSDDDGKSKPVLHIVDAGTKFQAAAFVPNSSVGGVWNTFLRIWACAYIGFPESMLTDQGSVFVSHEWKYNCELMEIQLKHTGTESHNSFGAAETYHSILRRIYNKVRADFPNVKSNTLLAMAVKAVNDTVGPHGL